MHNVFPGDNVPLEWACKLYIEWSAGETLSGDEFEVIFQNVQDLVEKLLALSPNSILGKMSKAILLYKAGSLMEAKNQLSAAVFDKLAANLYAVLVLCQVVQSSKTPTELYICQIKCFFFAGLSEVGRRPHAAKMR